MRPFKKHFPIVVKVDLKPIFFSGVPQKLFEDADRNLAHPGEWIGIDSVTEEGK